MPVSPSPPCSRIASPVSRRSASSQQGHREQPLDQGLTVAHLSAQLEACLTHKNTQRTLNTP
jgi:hypothetical protein